MREGGRRVRSFPSDSFVSGLSSCNPFRQNILHNPPSFLPSLSLVGSTFLRKGRPRPHIRHAYTGFIFENNDEEPDSFHAVDRPFFIAHSLIIFPAAQANWKHLFSSTLRPSVRVRPRGVRPSLTPKFLALTHHSPDLARVSNLTG